uniref:Small ribosomal subunit protein uS3c n=1 Tax=Scotinosphaera sp. NIES-154 TaxID=2249731 RepID=A0A2Z4MB14_9CHLO|nr:ribosomal protein S3 [Scotinosphaera sp. NIES-154]
MGQKVNPLGFRLGITKEHQSEWFANSKDYLKYVVEDSFIRQTITGRLQGILDVKIKRLPIINKIIVIVRTGNPDDIEKVFKQTTVNKKKSSQLFRDYLEKEIKLYRSKLNKLKDSNYFPETELNLKLEIRPIQKAFCEASFIAEFVVEQLEKKIPFRRALNETFFKIDGREKKIIRKYKNFILPKELDGVKVQISGRLNGAEIARVAGRREGRIPLQTLQANLDYVYKTAKTTYGILGIKVWVVKKV